MCIPLTPHPVGCTRPGVGRDASDWYAHAYVGATYLSFPGPCHSRPREKQDDRCRSVTEPGGQCRAPDGSLHCTWRRHTHTMRTSQCTQCSAHPSSH